MGSGTSQPKLAPTDSEGAMLATGEAMHDAEELFDQGKQAEAFKKVDEAHGHLKYVAADQIDNYATMVYAREGKLYLRANDHDRATIAFGKAMQRAEIRIAERCRGLYLLLQRYAECMVDQVKIWESKADKEADASERLKGYSKCEVGLLRCIELIEEGHNRRSDLLIVPLTRLSVIYEKLKQYKKAELLMRKCQGVIIVQFGYDHPDLQKIDQKLKLLERLNEEQAQRQAVIKIQSIARMHFAMKRIGERLNKPMKRHVLVPPAIRNERDKGEFLTKISNELAPNMAMGHQVVDENASGWESVS